MSTLAYGWVERHANVASCRPTSFKISILVLNICKLLVLWINMNMLNVWMNEFCFHYRMHYASVYIFMFNAFYYYVFIFMGLFCLFYSSSLLVVSSPSSVWGVGMWHLRITHFNISLEIKDDPPHTRHPFLILDIFNSWLFCFIYF